MKHVESRPDMLFIVLLLCGGYGLHAQVVELSGGTSTLYQSQGGEMTVQGRNYSASIGAGTVEGQFYGGAKIVRSLERTSLTLGSDMIPFDLPTDIFQSGHYLTGVGAGLRTKVGSTNLYSFIGATSTSFNSPFFEGARAETPAAILFASRKVAPEWTAATRVIFSQNVSIIHSFSWDSGNGSRFAIAGGLGADQPYIASSLWINRPLFDLKAAYIETGNQFRRVNVAMPLTSEPDHENVLFTIRPKKWMSLSAGRQNYLDPIYQSTTNILSSVDQASGTIQAAGFGLSAMVFQSSFEGTGNLAMAYTAGRNIGSRVQAQASYLISRPEHAAETDSLVTNVHETLTPRWTISQMVNTSEGHSTLGFGGSFLSNFATISADYQTYYVPTDIKAPFEQALIVNAQIHLFGRLTLGGGTFVAPDGHLLYTTEADGTVSRQMAGPVNAFEHHAFGSMVLRGRVLDTSGNPVMGAALMLDQLPVYTDSQGYFYMREHKSHSHPLTVLTNQFLDGELYRVVSAPAEITSSAKARAETIIVVARITSAMR